MKLARRLLIAFCSLAICLPFAAAQDETPPPRKTAHAKKAAADADATSSDEKPVRRAKRVTKAEDDSDADAQPAKARSKKAKRVRPTGVPDKDDEETIAAPAAAPIPGTAPRIPPNTRAQAVMVVDARTGEILYEKNADAPRAAASTQKLLTALVVAEIGRAHV